MSTLACPADKTGGYVTWEGFAEKFNEETGKNFMSVLKLYTTLVKKLAGALCAKVLYLASAQMTWRED